MRPRWTRQHFESKVAALEAFLRDQEIPADVPVISRIRDLQMWVDVRRGFRAWSSYSVVAPGGDNGDIRRRFDALIVPFARLQGGREQSRLESLVRLRERLREHEDLVRVLAAQNERLLTANNDLNARVTDLKRAIEAISAARRIGT